MYNKKYRLQNIETECKNPVHAKILGKVCYLAYFKVGERGWFLCDTEEAFDPVHRIHTSEIKDVQYCGASNTRIVVVTANTTYTFDDLEHLAAIESMVNSKESRR